MKASPYSHKIHSLKKNLKVTSSFCHPTKVKEIKVTGIKPAVTSRHSFIHVLAELQSCCRAWLSMKL